MWDAWDRIVAAWSAVKQIADRALGSASMEQEPELQDQQWPRSGRTPKIALDSTIAPWVPVTRPLLTKASASVIRKHHTKEIAELAGSRKEKMRWVS